MVSKLPRGLESLADNVISRVLFDIAEAITECLSVLQREEEEAGFLDPGPDPMPIAKREIRNLIVAAYKELIQLADSRRVANPESWAEAKIHEIDALIAEKYGCGFYFDLDKVVPEAITRGLQESRSSVTCATRPKLVPCPPVRTRQQGNQRKYAIGQIKADKLGISSRDVCREMDKHIASAQSAHTKQQLAPLDSWIKKVCTTGERTWVALYDQQPTHNLVKTYVDKVPASATRKV